MKFGIVLPNFGAGASRSSILDSALAAEKLGYDSVWLTDHVALPLADANRFGRIFEAMTTLSYLAGTTSRIRIGISSLVLPQRNPVEVAKQIATIDNLAGGRVMLATGIGWSEGEFANLGRGFKTRARRMDEALKVLRMLWDASEPVSFQGDFFHFDQLALAPLPVQLGGPLLWVAGNSVAALHRAAKFGDGWHPNYKSPEQLAAMLAEARPLIGERPFTVCLRLTVAFTEIYDPKRPLAGSSDQVREHLQALQQAGANQMILYFDAETQAAHEHAMKTFQKEIMASWQA